MDEVTYSRAGNIAVATVASPPINAMGIGPVLAVPKLLKQAGLSVADIGIWELNEAFASQVIYCRDRLGIPDDRLNVSGAQSPSATLTVCRARA
jgi:acetyl-CoA acetyltransferase